MKKLFAFGLTLAIAATLIGCKKKSEESSSSSDSDGGNSQSQVTDGNSQEKVVQDFCAAFRSGVGALSREFSRGKTEETKFADDGTREKNALSLLTEMADFYADFGRTDATAALPGLSL